jgi:TolA-binding protein
VKTSLMSGSLVLVLFGVSGCGASADSLVKEQIQIMNETAEALENKAPDAKVTELQKKLEETNKKLEALKLSDEEKKKVIEANKDELTKATMRLMKAGMNKTIGEIGKGFPGMPDLGKMPGFPGAGDQPAGLPGAVKKQ